VLTLSPWYGDGVKLKKLDLCDGSRLALAVSGGSDSLALLYLALDEFPPSKLVVLTVDHGLREGSRAEAEQVSRWCASLGVEQHILTWSGEKPQTGIQAKARTARYDLMTQWCREHGVAALLTGHTMDDQAETVAMRLARTRSLKSLAGIWPETNWNGIRVLRPLLEFRRRALQDMLRAQSVTWLDDPSNENEAFERVRIRKSLAHAEIAALAARADAARRQVSALQEEAQSFFKEHCRVSPLGFVTLPRDRLRVLSSDLGCEALALAVALASGGREPDSEQILQLATRIRAAEPFRVTLAGAVIAGRKAEVLVGREAGRIVAASAEVGPGGTLLWDGRFQVNAPPGSRVVAAGHRCPRPKKDIPAFVLAALPMVTLPDNREILPHFDGIPGVLVTFREGFPN
jgi:tRNA(Ile)-lysidine synthase